jgi:superfamily II DNA or RNA helicase
MKRHLGLALIKEDPQLKLKLTLPNPEYRSRSIYTPYSKKEVEETLTYYKEVSDGFLVPRNYKGATAYPKVESPIIKALKFKGALRNYQKDYLKKVFSSSTNEDSIFEVPCGHGKTVMAAWVICNRLQKTLILVPTNTLVEQWVQRLEEFIYGAKVSVAEASKKIVDIENSDIIIMTYELYNSKYADKEEVKEKIGQVIIDEAHRVGAQTYSPIIEELPAKYRLALSAPFRRQ